MNAPAAAVLPHVEAVGRGPAIVLLHGWGLHSGLWGPLVARLARRHRVLAVDLPGHGHSAPVEPFTLDAVAAAVAVAVDGALDAAQPPVVLGWSFGGLVALQWALARPGRVAKLVLVGATPRFAAAADWPHAMAPATLRQFADELRVAYRHTLQRFLALQVHGSEHGRAALAAMRHELFARGEPAAAVLAHALDALIAADLRAQLPAVTVPTLVIAGTRDALAPAAAGAWLARALPDARYVEIAGAGHAPFLSHPDAFATALEGFLDGR
jgi:pimeloyl-[acyl-carrier protein] methyl ester esterase